MKTIEERVNNPLEASDILYASVTFNADPWLVESIDEAEDVLRFLADCHLYPILPDSYKFESACLDLDLDPIENKVKCVFFFMNNSGFNGHICFNGDWVPISSVQIH